MFLDGWNVLSATLNQIFLAHSVLVSLIGLAMNIIVLFRMRKLSRRNSEQFYNGIGVCLSVLSLVDLVSLCALFLQYINISIQVDFNETLQNLICKTITFSSHTAYTQGMFSLTVMSMLRYISIRRPLEYRLSWRLPFIALSVAFVIGVTLNAWLLVDVTHQNGQCMQTYSTAARAYKLVDISVSFLLPITLVCFFDLSVLCCRIESPFSDPMLQIVINRPTNEKRKSLNRFLIITISCIVLNLPENLLRLFSALNIPLDAVPLAVVLSKMLFFSQFAFKSFYLTTFVYDRSVLSKTNSSRQLSISFRQRLEESSHMIRERASTMSYRASTPLPRIQRNSSFAALDQLMPGKYSF